MFHLPDMISLNFVLGVFLFLAVARGDATQRVKRQNQNGELIDNIFNIPITAIKQTAAAAQVVYPENHQAIDSVLKIPVATLQAVGSLVKITSSQRRERNPEDLQRIRRERRDRVLALKQQKIERELRRSSRHHHRDPLGLNALSDLLVGHHGIFGGHSSFFGHGGHGGSGIHNFFGSYGSHGGHGNHGKPEKPHKPHKPEKPGHHGSHGGHGQGGSSSSSHSYEVHENVDEGDSPYEWPGFGGFFTAQPSTPSDEIQNKIAPNSRKIKELSYTNNPRKKTGKSKYENDELFPEHKIARANDRINFRSL